jgi:formylglycine-generating enzyme
VTGRSSAPWGARATIAGVAFVQVLTACEILLDTGSLTERATGDAGGRDATLPGDDAREGGDEASCGPPGALATGATSGIGCPCTQEGQLACNGNAQAQTLICNRGAWGLRSTCPTGQNCDSRTGGSQGTCAAIDRTCMGAMPNQAICSTSTTAVQCGPDLVSDIPLATCSNQACVNGTCVGTCVPNETMCFGNGFQTCGADGGWEKATACGESCSDGGCSFFPSCKGGGPGAGMDCGGTGGDAGTSDCCASYDVRGGSFDRSYDAVTPGFTNAGYNATVSDFRLDAYEATVGRFRAFVSAVVSGYQPVTGSGKHAYLNGGSGLTNVGGGDAGASEPGWSASWNANLGQNPTAWNTALGCNNATWTATPGSNEHRPINCVSWYEAYAFCIWDGGFLPSEAEWNYAASGGSEQRVYPWSSPATSTTIDCQHATYAPMGMPACSSSGPTDVGFDSPLGDGKFGQSDLAGNVSEWTLDSFASYVNPCVDCSNVSPLGSPVQRGGSYDLVASALLTSYRFNDGPAMRDGSIGVRCARSP